MTPRWRRCSGARLDHDDRDGRRAVQPIVPSLPRDLAPTGAAARCSSRALALGFTAEAGQIHVPNLAPPTASFVREGQPIPLGAGLTSGVILAPKKIAVIITLTRE